MEKKPTVKDIAKEAGVSVATVSYILNDRKDQKISDETRKKVLQIANLLNYRPSHAAKTLATGKTNIIGIAYALDFARPSRNLEIMTLVNLLIERLNRMQYDVVTLSTDAEFDHLPLNRNIDGIVAIDLPDDKFHHLADSYLVPVIAVDMLVNDSLFYQIYTDYPQKICEVASPFDSGYILILERFSNELYNRLIQEGVSSKVFFYDELDDMTLSTLADQKIIVIGNYLALLLASKIPASNMLIITAEENANFIPSDSQKLLIDTTQKANFVINLLMNAIDRKFEVSHTFPM